MRVSVTTDTMTLSADELVRQLGADAARYAVLRRARNPQGRLDLERWRRATGANPVFAVRFAHARLLRAARYAAERRAAEERAAERRAVEQHAAEQRAVEQGRTGAADGARTPLAPSPGLSAAQSAAVLSALSATGTLRRLLGQYPVVLGRAAGRGQPHRLTRYLESLAAAVTELLTLVPEPFEHIERQRVTAPASGPGIHTADTADGEAQANATDVRAGAHSIPADISADTAALAQHAADVLRSGLTALGISAPEQL